jgi:peroxiredoxin
MLELGDDAIDFALDSAEGLPVSLSDVLSQGRNVLLVFLRHLG